MMSDDDIKMLLKQLDTYRAQVKKLKARNYALTELLECAARGGHMVAQQIIDVIGGYNLELVKENSDE